MATRCKKIQESIEQDVWQPIDEWVKSTQKKCEEYDWWNPIGWFCWLVTIVVKIVVWVLVKIVTVFIRIVCEVINFFANLFGAILNAILAIPIVGPLVRAFIRAVVTAISYVIGLIDGLARLFGIRITKHLRVHVFPLCEGNIPLAYEVNLSAIMTETARILYDRAQIRVHTTVHEPIRNPPEDALRLGTGVELILDEAWLKGTWHQMQTVKLFESNVWSQIGLGHPVLVFVIREVGYDGPGTVVGASGGPFMDWVAVERDTVVDQVVATAAGGAVSPLVPFPPTVASAGVTGIPNAGYQKRVVAHEICHALGLIGHANSNPGELMVPGNITGDALSPFQVGIIRSSGHVTFV